MHNSVIVEFYDSFCAIKDKGTGTVLLEGTIKDGLYQVKTASTKNNQEVTGQKFTSVTFVSCLAASRNKIKPLLVTSPSNHYVLYASKDV